MLRMLFDNEHAEENTLPPKERKQHLAGKSVCRVMHTISNSTLQVPI